MNKENLNRLKKYLFLISLFFVFVFGGHILYVYLYNDAIENPIEGGSISEGIIGDIPSLNPLLPSSDYNKNIVHQLYRSLIKYDYVNKKFTGDLADCDISNLGYIECYLHPNLKWSNGDSITTGDILATFNVIKNSDINPVISSLLKETTIEEKDSEIIFSNRVKDVNFLNVLLQPIVSKNVLDNIGNKELSGNFNPLNGVFSGEYKIDNLSYDDSLGIQKLILSKNENYDGSGVLINKYTYKFFKDSSHFLKHKDSVNVFYDQNNIVGDSLIRLDKKPFYLNKFTAVFLNQDRISSDDLRNFILSKIDVNNILKNLGKGYKEVKNPYLTDESIEKEVKNSNLESIIKDLGYYKKDELTKVIIANNSANQAKTVQNNNTQQKVNGTLKVITSPINKRYNFITSDDILLKGVVNNKSVEEVYINGFKLTSFKKGNSEFYYRLKQSLNTIKEGINTYKIDFVISGKKTQVEEFYVTYYKDKNKVDEIEKNFFASKPQTSTGTIASSTGTNIQSKTKIDSKELEKIKSLDDKFYYNSKLEKFSLKFYYLDNQKEFPDVANIIKSNLETYGIDTEIIPISLSDLNTKALNGEKDYDMILIGIDLGYFNFNIFPYFHSSQVKGGYNFSNKKDLNIDVLLEELKSNIFDEEKSTNYEKQVLEFLKNKQIVKTLYSKENVLLVDKNIKNFKIEEQMPNILGIEDALFSSYTNSDKQIVFKTKGIIDFFKFIKNLF